MLKQISPAVGSARRLGIVVLAAAVLAACAFVPDSTGPARQLGDSSNPTGPNSAKPDPTNGEQRVAGARSDNSLTGFPALSSVPSELPSHSTEAVRRRREQDLLDDRQSAVYSNEPLAGTTPAAAPSLGVPQKPGLAPVPPNQAQTMGDGPVIEGTTVVSSRGSQVEELPPAFPDGEPRGYGNVAAGQPAYNAPYLSDAPGYLSRLSGQTGYQAQYHSQPYAANSPGVTGSYFNGRTMLPSGRLIAVLYFDNGSAVIDEDGQAVLRDIASFYGQTGGSVMVVGHSSSRTLQTSVAEHQEVNYRISLARAKAVAAALVAQGVPQELLSTEARADTSPVFHEFMPTGEAGNRRVEVYLN